MCQEIMENVHNPKFEFKQEGLFVGLLAVRIVPIFSVLLKVKFVFCGSKF